MPQISTGASRRIRLAAHHAFPNDPVKRRRVWAKVTGELRGDELKIKKNSQVDRIEDEKAGAARPRLERSINCQVLRN
jgi:hypothetical protein